MNAVERMRLRRSVKEALDNLPMGICFFNREGLPILCNHRMHDLVFRMTGHDLQTLTELAGALGISADGGEDVSCQYSMPDGSTWSFSLKPVTAPEARGHTQVIAFEITELCAEQKRLRQALDAQRSTLEALEALQKNVVAITREEEVLAMKMRLHNDLGYDLQVIRRYMERGFPAEDKDAFIARQRETLRRLRVPEEKKRDPLKTLLELATSLKMHIAMTGSVPNNELTRSLLPLILRECLINTGRHTHGDTVFAVSRCDGAGLRMEITNNGEPPGAPISEGGGLTSLRERIEALGGSMIIESVPVFRLTILLPMTEEDIP